MEDGNSLTHMLLTVLDSFVGVMPKPIAIRLVAEKLPSLRDKGIWMHVRYAP